MTFAGLDWASAEHAVCVIDDKGAIQAQFSVTHSAAGMAELRQRLRRLRVLRRAGVQVHQAPKSGGVPR